MNKSIIGLSIGVIAIMGFAYFAMFTPAGVHFVGEDLFPNDEAEMFAATEYPTVVQKNLTAETIPLPSKVTQPSGVDYDKENDTFVIVTDQAEILELSNDFSTVIASEVMSDKPLLFRQGSVESADYFDGSLYVSGDEGQLEIWERDGSEWVMVGEIMQPATTIVGAEGMAIDPTTGHIYMGNGEEIHVIDQSGQYLQELTIAAEVKSGRSFAEYDFAGLDFYDGVLYVVSEYHGVIFAIDPETGVVIDSYGLSGLEQGAGLTVTADAFYVVVDHENNEPSPGVKKYPRLSNTTLEINSEVDVSTAATAEELENTVTEITSVELTPTAIAEVMPTMQPETASKVESVTPVGNITEADARRIALTQIMGEVESIELESEDGQLVYEIEYESGDEVEIDAQTGAVLTVERES